MSNATIHPVKYKLTGVQKGKSGRFFGFDFKDGECVISGAAHDSCGHVLVAHYAAYPEDTADKMNAEPGADFAKAVKDLEETPPVQNEEPPRQAARSEHNNRNRR